MDDTELCQRYWTVAGIMGGINSELDSRVNTKHQEGRYTRRRRSFSMKSWKLSSMASRVPGVEFNSHRAYDAVAWLGQDVHDLQ